MENFNDKIELYLGEIVTFVDDINGRTKTGKLFVGTLITYRDATMCLYNERDVMVAVMHVRELQNVSESHTCMVECGPLFYGPFYL